MATLTKSRIDIADRHTTLCAFSASGKKKTPARLPLGTEKGYTDLYSQVEHARLFYESLNNNKAGQILDKLFRVYGKEKYWKRYLNGAEPAPPDAWSAGLPLLADLAVHVNLILPPGFKGKVSPLPRVLLYPFGWSTWISMRIVEAHTLDQLDILMTHLFTQKCFQVVGSAQPLKLEGFLDMVSNGIRTDAFCGKDTADLEAKGKAIVITVMEKHNGSLSWKALNDDDRKKLRRMIRPEGSESSQQFNDMVFQLPSKDELNYLVIDRLGRFIWLEELLGPGPGERNPKFLECYHHNSFRALVQAWNLLGLMMAGAAVTGKKSAPLKDLLRAARLNLEAPNFKNASIQGFLKLDEVKKALHPKS